MTTPEDLDTDAGARDYLQEAGAALDAADGSRGAGRVQDGTGSQAAVFGKRRE